MANPYQPSSDLNNLLSNDPPPYKEIGDIYYQLFEDSHRIASKSAFNPQDVYTGRILAQRLAPAHTIATVKRHIAALESIDQSRIMAIYISEDDIAAEDDSRIIRTPGDVAGSVWQPLVILIKRAPPHKDSRKPWANKLRPHATKNSKFGEPVLSTNEPNKVATSDKPQGWIVVTTRRSMGLHDMEWSGMMWESMGRVGEPLPVGAILYADGESVPYKSYRYRRVIVPDDRRVGYYLKAALNFP